MTKLDSTYTSVTEPATSHFNRGPTNRLIVLVPAQASDYPSQAHRIWEIAKSYGLSVLLLSLCDDPYEESQYRRQLIMMAAMISDSTVCTDIRIEHGKDWVRPVRSVSQPGDVIACYAGQRTGFMQRPLHEILQVQLAEPIYILSVDQPIKSARPRLLSKALFWMGSLIILAVFFGLEVKLTQLPQDWAYNLLFLLCVLVETGVLVLWNSIFQTG